MASDEPRESDLRNLALKTAGHVFKRQYSTIMTLSRKRTGKLARRPGRTAFDGYRVMDGKEDFHEESPMLSASVPLSLDLRCPKMPIVISLANPRRPKPPYLRRQYAPFASK